MKKSEQNKIIEEIKEMRVDIDGITQFVEHVNDHPEGKHKNNSLRSREISITITKLQEGKMWLGKLLQSIGAINPYPESMNSDNEIIEPTADVLRPPAVACFDAKKGEKLTHIKRVKQLKQMIEDIVSSQLFSVKTLNKWQIISKEENRALFTLSLINSYTYLTEAKMWIGMELSRIKQETNS